MSCGGGHLGFPTDIKNNGKNVSKCFFSETTLTVETKLPRNDHWQVLYKFSVFYAGRKSKMAATAEHRLTLDPMGKYSNAFFSESQTVHECSLDGPLQTIRFLFRYEIQNGGYSRT